MRACGVALIHSGSGAGQLIAPRTGVSRNMKARIVIGPVDQAVLENRIRSGDALRCRHGVADLPWILRPRDGKRAAGFVRASDLSANERFELMKDVYRFEE